MQHEDQISVKDIILQIISFGRLLRKNWYLFLLFAGIGAGIGFAIEKLKAKKPEYKAITTFYLETAAPQNEMGGFASMMGINTGGNNSNNLFNGENLRVLVASQSFLEKVVLKNVDVFGEKHLLADYIFQKQIIESAATAGEEKSSNPEVKPKSTAATFKPLPGTDVRKFSIPQIDQLTTCTGLAYGMASLEPVEGTSFMTLSISSVTDTLSKVYGEAFLSTLEEYYLETKTGKLYDMLNRQKDIVDSLRYKLSANENQLARLQDLNQTSILSENKVSENRINRNTQILTETYREQEKILNNLKFQTYQESPFMKITTVPRLPLEPEKVKKGQMLLPGALIGLFICFFFVLIRNAVKSIMAQ
jgi:hypothetical protein